MIDFWRSAIRQQFHAAIDMLANAIKACPDSVWSGQGRSAFWYLAFHVLFLPRFVSLLGRRIPIPSATTVRSHGARTRGRCARARLRKRRTTWLPRALPQKVGRGDGGNDRSLGCRSLSLPVSRDEQRRTAPLQYAALATS